MERSIKMGTVIKSKEYGRKSRITKGKRNKTHSKEKGDQRVEMKVWESEMISLDDPSGERHRAVGEVGRGGEVRNRREREQKQQ